MILSEIILIYFGSCVAGLLFLAIFMDLTEPEWLRSTYMLLDESKLKDAKDRVEALDDGVGYSEQA